MPIPRNPVVRAGALLRKGGVHKQSASGHRHQGKRQLDDEIDDWFEGECGACESVEVCFPPDEQTEPGDHSRRLKQRKGWGRSTPEGLICGSYGGD